MRDRIDDEITFRKLEVLLAFMQTGSLAKAAEVLNVSTVSVHRALHSLEKGVRCALFRHEGRNLRSTDAAQMLADVSDEVLTLMSDGIRATREAAGYSSDRLKIGSLYSLTIRTVPGIVVDIKVRRPALQVELVLGPNAELIEKLKQGAIDAALMALPDAEPELASVPLFEDDIFFAAPAHSPYANLEAVDLRDCRDETFVSLGEGFATYHGFQEAFRVAGFTPNVTMQVGDIYSLMNLVSGGVGYTLLPGRVRGVFGEKVQFIPLKPQYLMRQTIGVSFLRARERDPNLLALMAVCRLRTRNEG
ncbi:LysR family transcriptional regulator [Paraburkholderia phenoliruptrix]|uniref:LysR family transcriptional regulator n=1 Tax=Paraburkholderia phenoliruptrix TaxID=252970 RepID=UPI001C4E3C6C|nr:LysR family transcriptional regulator [Paraburkholderia phenoliruptrix]MBW0447666.1 LysR family transcriptional regulator [Paraburkholderia phenoliruptrix]MBW9098858.1 LysR family transcriptional regulator [Paraburkholderia phenoliruptrix]